MIDLLPEHSRITVPWACKRRAIVVQAVLAPLVGVSAPRAQAEAGPVELKGLDIKLVVPVEPGGGIDSVARMLAAQWGVALDSTVSVINRPGASGNIGTVSVARSKPDGLTLLVTGMSHLSSPLLHVDPGYDPLGDFVAIARIATAPNVLLVGADLHGVSLVQLLGDPRWRRQELSYGSAGYGHTSHLAAEVFMARTGVQWLHVPYKGTSPALRALMAGEVQVMFAPVSSVATVLATGKAQALAVAHPRRLESLPEVPTLVELGIHDAEFSQWYGLFAPRSTPGLRTSALSSAAVAAIEAPGMGLWLRSHGLEPSPQMQMEFSRFLSAEQRRLASLLRSARVDRPVR